MGLMLSAAKRSLNQYNIEERAHRIISRDKPTPAPKHASAKRLPEITPEVLTGLSKKNTNHDERLKHVYLDSFDVEINRKDKPDTLKPLPTHRKPMEEDDPEFGFHNPARVPYGKCSLKQALDFIKDHSANKETHTVKDIAAKYKLNEEVTGNILKYFRLFEVYIPPKAKAKSGNLLSTSVEASKTVKSLPNS